MNMKIFGQIKTLVSSKRFWICVAVVATSSSGLLPHDIVDKIGIVAVVATKVIDSWNGEKTQ